MEGGATRTPPLCSVGRSQRERPLTLAFIKATTHDVKRRLVRRGWRQELERRGHCDRRHSRDRCSHMGHDPEVGRQGACLKRVA